MRGDYTAVRTPLPPATAAPWQYNDEDFLSGSASADAVAIPILLPARHRDIRHLAHLRLGRGGGVTSGDCILR